MEGEKFQGFIESGEKQALTPEQAEKLSGLEKVLFANGHYEEFLGTSNVLDRADNTPKIIIKPSSLLRFVKETAEENHTSPWEVTQAIRSLGIEDPERLAEIQKRYKEGIVYVGDVHGGDQKLRDALAELGKTPPQYLIFEGDLIGTKNFEDLQRTFYNYLNNHSRNELLKTNPDATDDEILSYAGTKPPEEGFSLKNGFLKLRDFELRLAGKSDKEVKAALEALTDHDIADEIRRYAKFVHYGHYASNLPEEAKQTLASGLEENALALIRSIQPLIDKGTKVIMLEGNWDARAPIDFVPGEEKAVPLPEEERLFRARKFFEEHGIPFLRQATTLETKTTLQILFPFDSLVNFPSLDETRKRELQKEVQKARDKGKTIIAVAHGEPNWQIHNLPDPEAVPGGKHDAVGEHAQIIKGFDQALGLLLPDEIVYGHIHDPILDEKKNSVGQNTKYALQVMEDGEVELASNPENFDSQSILASYVPMRKLAELEVPIHSSSRKVEGLGGTREPIRVK